MAKKNDGKFLKDFGKNVKKLRLARGLSTRKFASAAEIAHSSVERIEKGESNPTLTTLIRISDALKIDLNKLALIK